MHTQTTQKNSEEKTRKAEWKRVKLTDLGELNRGRSRHRPRNDASMYGGKYPFIQTSDIKSVNCYISEYSQTYNEKGLAQSKLWEPDTLCITIAANISESAILKIPACFPDSVVGFRSYKNVSDVRFVKYLLDLFKKDFQAISSGAAQDNLSLEKMLFIDFLVPEYKEQKKIAEVLSAYDDLIEVNQKKIKTLETLAQTLYKEWFVKPAKNGLPDGWEETTLDNLCDLKKDKFIKKDHENLPLVDMARINSKSLSITNTGNSEELSTSRIIFQNGDILFGSIRCYLHKVALAPFNGVTNVSVFVVRPKEDYLKSFLYCHLFNADTLRWADQNSSGTKMPVIKWEVFKNKKIILPQKEKLSEFNNLVGDFFEQIKLLSIENQNLQKTRDVLIPQLVGGRVEVK